MKRIVMFLVTNIAVMVVLGIVLAILLPIFEMNRLV